MTKHLRLILASFLLLSPLTVQAGAKVLYSPEVVDTALTKGCSVFLEFGASW